MSLLHERGAGLYILYILPNILAKASISKHCKRGWGPVLPRKAQRLTFQVSRYCILAVRGSIHVRLPSLSRVTELPSKWGGILDINTINAICDYKYVWYQSCRVLSSPSVESLSWIWPNTKRCRRPYGILPPNLNNNWITGCQHWSWWTMVKQSSCIICVYCGVKAWKRIAANPENTRRWNEIGLMLAHRPKCFFPPKMIILSVFYMFAVTRCH